MIYSKEIQERFWAKVNKTKSCWIWTACIRNKYGAMKIRKKMKKSNRISYEIYFGKIPENKFVCHKCDNPLCVRPEHLFIGTPKQNTNDMLKKHRHSFGENRPLSKLTVDKVRQIRREYENGEGNSYTLAKKYGIQQSTMHAVIARQTWKHA